MKWQTVDGVARRKLTHRLVVLYVPRQLNLEQFDLVDEIEDLPTEWKLCFRVYALLREMEDAYERGALNFEDDGSGQPVPGWFEFLMHGYGELKEQIGPKGRLYGVKAPTFAHAVTGTTEDGSSLRLAVPAKDA